MTRQDSAQFDLRNDDPVGVGMTAVVTRGDAPDDIRPAPTNGYAMEARAETLRVVTLGDAVRRGETEQLSAGNVEHFSDVVYGEEQATINGPLEESTKGSSTFSAKKLEVTVNGRLSVSAVGWPENKLSGEDVILLGGALTDTWTGGALIAAAISDDLVVGPGARITSPLDLSLNQLTALQERPGTVCADGLFREQYGTLFEREYGSGAHRAGLAWLSGTVYQTQRTGFRPLMRTAMGVRNLIPAAGGGVAPEPSPPAPPPGPSSTAAGGVGAGTMVATTTAGGAVGTARGADNLQDMSRIANAAADLEDASALHRSEDTADTLEGLTAAARAGDPDATDGVGTDGVTSTLADQLGADDSNGWSEGVSQRLDFADYTSHGPVDDIDEPLDLLSDVDDAATAPGRVETPDEFPTVARPAGDTETDPSVRFVEFGGELDPDPSQQSRAMLDVEVDMIDDGVERGLPTESSPGLDPSIVDSGPTTEPPVQARLDDSGTDWSVPASSAETSPGTYGAGASDDAANPRQGKYQPMTSAESGIGGSGATSPGATPPADTPPAALDTSANRRVPDDFDCVAVHAVLDTEYHKHRGASNWHALEAYGVVNDLREDLRLMVGDLGGHIGDGDIERLYTELQRLRTKAILDGDVLRTEKIDRFLDWYHLKVYDTSTDLARRADEFNGALTGVGGTQLLDPDIDRAKLQGWLEEQRDTALAKLNAVAGLNDSQIETLGREFPYYHQLALALEEGRDPIIESLDEIQYLRSVNNLNQVDEYMQYHQRVIAMLRDPSYRTGFDAADQLASVYTELGPIGTIDETATSLGGGFQTNVMNASANGDDAAQSIDGIGEVATADYGANRLIINDLVGTGDYATAPVQRPHWIDGVHFRQILFPAGDPGFEHLFEGSFAAGNIHGIVEGAKTAEEHEADARYLDHLRHSPIATRLWDAGIARHQSIRFGDMPRTGHSPDPRRARSEGSAIDLFGMGAEVSDGAPGKPSPRGSYATGVLPLPRLPRFGGTSRQPSRVTYRGRERMAVDLVAGNRLDADHVSATPRHLTARGPSGAPPPASDGHDDRRKLADLVQRLRTGADMRILASRAEWEALDAMQRVLDAAEEIA